MSEAKPLPAGTTLERYTLTKVLGAGGFGITYLAEHDTLGLSALKEYLPANLAEREGTSLHPTSDDNQEIYNWGLNRFLREARTLRDIKHPNVVVVHDVYQANGTAYMAMEYVEGESLKSFLTRKIQMSGDEVEPLLEPLLSALEAVHKAGYLHRDLNPSNILLRGGRIEDPVLIDFGAARQVQRGTSIATHLLVTEGYSATEQYSASGTHGAWTDIYALCATLYHCVTGRVPETSIYRAEEIARGNRDPLFATSAASVDIDPALAQAIDRGLSLDETQRPRSVAEWRSIAERDRSEDQPNAGHKTGYLAGTGFRLGLGSVAAAIVAIAGWLYFGTLQTKPMPEPELPAAAAPISEKELLSGLGILRLESDPTGASITIDGLELGTTPFETWDILAGQHTVEVDHPYRERHVEIIDTVDNVVVSRRFVLEAAVGSLTVLSTPADAWIELDGERRVEVTPQTLASISAGEHTLSVGKDGYGTASTTLAIRRGARIREEVQLERLVYGSLNVIAEPQDARVSITSSSGKSWAHEAGLRLPVGTYEILVEAAGYSSHQRREEITLEGTVIDVTLERLLANLDLVVEPPDARVEFTGNRELSYTPGMMLPPGEYAVAVHADGFETLQRNIEVEFPGTSTTIRLKRIPRPVIEAVPRVADQTPDPLTQGIGAFDERRFPSAFQLLLPLAEAGMPEAQSRVGDMFAAGLGTVHDDTQAASWYKMAAEQGNVNAQVKLGGMYEGGLGVHQDRFLSYVWYSVAVRAGEPLASINRDRVASGLQPVEIEQARLMIETLVSRSGERSRQR